jgi:hypothetical protein
VVVVVVEVVVVEVVVVEVVVVEVGQADRCDVTSGGTWTPLHHTGRTACAPLDQYLGFHTVQK